MKSESEFIRGVYEKYEEEKLRCDAKRRRLMLLSRAGAVGICACFAIVTVINIIPLARSKNNFAPEADAANADGAENKMYTYKMSAEAADEAEYADDAVLSMVTNGAVMAQNDNSLVYDVTEEAAEIMPEEETVKKGEGENIYTACGENGRFVFSLENEYTREERGFGYELTENGEVKASIYVNAVFVDCRAINEENAENDAVFGECDTGGYIRYESHGDHIIMILSEELSKSVGDIAATLEYELFS